MTENDASIEERISRIRSLAKRGNTSDKFVQAASIAQSVINDTVGLHHPAMISLNDAVTGNDWTKALGACEAVVALYETDALRSPRLQIAAEIETDILATANLQIQAAELGKNKTVKTIQVAIAAFLAGSALEDALRRLCDANSIAYDPSNTSISKLQSLLYQPSAQVELIGRSDVKQITAWGDTRNKADHGKFDELTLAEVTAMTIGVQSFIDRHLVGRS